MPVELLFTSALLVGSCVLAAPGLSKDIAESLWLPADLETMLDH